MNRFAILALLPLLAAQAFAETSIRLNIGAPHPVFAARYLGAWGLDSCGFTGCWRDALPPQEAAAFGFTVRGDTAVYTGRRFVIECGDGEQVSYNIPRTVGLQYTSEAFANTCGNEGINKVTLQAGVAGQYFNNVKGHLQFWAIP